MRRDRSLAGPTTIVALALAFVLVALVGCQVLDRGGAATAYPPTTVEHLTVQSTMLHRAMPVLLFRPRGVDAADLPILYVFHGFGADETSWFAGHDGDGVHLDGQAQVLIDAGRICPVVIASAFIGNSYGVDSEAAGDQFDHGPYASYLTAELFPAVEARVQGEGRAASAGDRFVAGLSMGGFAALHLGLTRPDTVGGVGALSPAMFVDTPNDRRWLFDGRADGNDPMRLVRTVPGGDLTRLRWFLGDGTSDYGWIKAGTAELAHRLGTRGVDVPVLTVPGGHDGGTWRQLAGPLLEALLPPCAIRPAASATSPATIGP